MLRALKVSYSDVEEGRVAVNCEKTQFFLNTLYIHPLLVTGTAIPNIFLVFLLERGQTFTDRMGTMGSKSTPFLHQVLRHQKSVRLPAEFVVRDSNGNSLHHKNNASKWRYVIEKDLNELVIKKAQKDDILHPESDGPPDDDSGQPDGDSGPPDNDSGPPDDDSGPPDEDRGQPDEDSGPPDDDSGPPDDDSGQPDDDSGPSDDDRGPPDDYSGPPDNDSGPPDDKSGPPP